MNRWIATVLPLIAAGCQTTTTPATNQPAVPWPALKINEIVPSNTAGLNDDEGDHADWIEVFNPEPRVVSLQDYTFADGAVAFQIDDDIELPAGGVVVLFADGSKAKGHLDLRLDRNGETLSLFDPDGVEIDAITWGPLIPNHSLARIPDGGEDWQVQPEPTPGDLNQGEPLGATPATPCGLAVDQSGRYITEGEVLHLEADCGPGAWRYDWFGPTQATGADLDLDTAPDTAGTYEILVSAKQMDAAGVPTTQVIEVSVADNWAAPNNLPVDPAAYTREWGLPVLHLGIDPVGIPQDYVPTGAWFDGVEYTAQIKIRGAASAGYPKNNFTVEFDPIQLPLGPYGLSNKDHLVLVGNFDDNSHLRQRMVYDAWAAIADFWGEPRLTPRSTPIAVYMNGRYHGLYLALDHVDDEFLREMGTDSGGDLYKSVSHDANFYRTNAGGNPKGTMHDGWEKKEGLDPYSFAPLDALTAWTGSASHAEVAADLSAELPPEEFMDWFHLVRAFAADDSAAKNAYLYVDPLDGRFRYVPWDFNHALGQTWQTARQAPDGVSDYVWNNALFWHFQNEPGMAATLWDRDAALRAPGGPLALDPLLALLAQYDAELVGHPDRDWERWGAEYHAYGLWNWRTDWTTPAQERAYVEQWIRDRAAILSP